MITFAIITPTTGNIKLSKLIESINNQNENINRKIEHYIVVDGPHFKKAVEEILDNNKPLNHERFIFQLPFNTGKDSGNYLGHKIYASIGQLVRSEWVLLADEDNWYEPEHIDSFIENINNYNEKPFQKNKIDWLYCLRRIVNDKHNYICDDNCESLGHLNPVFYNNNDRLIDTNCYCIRREIMINCSYIWNKIATNDNTDPDRLFGKKLMTDYVNFICTKKYTLNYYTGNRNDSVKSDLFVNGNELIFKMFKSFPWQREVLYIAHFDNLHTERVLNRVYGGNNEPLSSVAYHQWNLNFFDLLSKKFLLINAYINNQYIPAGSKIILNMCSPLELPNKLLERKDIQKIIYTYESPNIRHQKQWDLEFLLPTFNNILTYWNPLLEIKNIVPNKIDYLPFISRFDMTNPNDLSFIIENTNNHKKICIILENRNIKGNYNINGIQLNAQDYLRLEYSTELGKRIYCYGSTWEPYKHIINYCPSKNRHLDIEFVGDIMKQYTFCLIIENCNAQGYVSEKIYDALTVGCIPLYYGNNNALLGIPDDCYIDIKFISPKELPNFIDSIDDVFIEMFRKNIYNKRMQILEKVSINNYTNIINNVLNG